MATSKELAIDRAVCVALPVGAAQERDVVSVTTLDEHEDESQDVPLNQYYLRETENSYCWI